MNDRQGSYKCIIELLKTIDETAREYADLVDNEYLIIGKNTNSPYYMGIWSVLVFLLFLALFEKTFVPQKLPK